MQMRTHTETSLRPYKHRQQQRHSQQKDQRKKDRVHRKNNTMKERRIETSWTVHNDNAEAEEDDLDSAASSRATSASSSSSSVPFERSYAPQHRPDSKDRERRTQEQETALEELETTYDDTNGNRGAMFDLSSPDGEHELEIHSLDIHVNRVDPACPILVYGRPGTHVGFENSTEAWTLLVNATIDCRGYGARTLIPSASFLSRPKLRGGDVYAIYTQLDTPNLRYTDGQELSAITASNAMLRIHEGTGVSGSFGVGGVGTPFVRPRIWNGVVRYNVTVPPSRTGFMDGCEGTLTSTYQDNLGSFGNMFDVRTKDGSVIIDGIDLYTDLLDSVTYEILTRPGTYAEAMSADYLPNLSVPGISATTGPVVNGVDGNTTNATIPATVPSNTSDLIKWTLVKRGTVNGRGVGRGTPIRDFAPIVVGPNSRQSLYVTLTTPDLRYRDLQEDFPDTKAGDIFFENDDLALEVGISVGTYPLDTTFFGPRLWSGSLSYQSENGCPSASPTTMPTIDESSAPSLAPEPSALPSMDPTYSVPDLGNCTDVSTVDTTFAGGTAAYGNMFTVTAGPEPLSITTMDIHLGNTTSTGVTVYTRDGSYKGFERTPTAWRKIAETTVQGKGDGVGTPIPTDQFHTVHLRASATRAFYVTVSSADIRYTRVSAIPGEAYASSPLLSVNVGAGFVDPDFGLDVFEPRVFNGRVHFLHGRDCAATVATSITYNFQIFHDGLEDEEIFRQVNTKIETTTRSFVASDTTLQTYSGEYDLDVDSVESVLSSKPCSSPDSTRDCTPVDTTIHFSHEEALDTGDLTYIIRDEQESVVEELDALEELDVIYAGPIPTDGKMLVTLSGESIVGGLTDEQIAFFEDQLKMFLGEKLGGSAGVNVLGVRVDTQTFNEMPGTGRKLQRSDDDDVAGSSTASSSISMATTITGEYRPPPYVDLGNVASDAIDGTDGGDAFRDELSIAARERPEELDLFTKIDDVGAEALSPSGESTLPTGSSSSSSSSSSSIAMAAGITGGLVVVVIIFVLWWRRRNNRTRVQGDNLDVLEAEDDTSEFYKKNQKNTGFGLFGRRDNDSDTDGIIDAECVYAPAYPANEKNGPPEGLPDDEPVFPGKAGRSYSGDRSYTASSTASGIGGNGTPLTDFHSSQQSFRSWGSRPSTTPPRSIDSSRSLVKPVGMMAGHHSTGSFDNLSPVSQRHIVQTPLGTRQSPKPSARTETDWPGEHRRQSHTSYHSAAGRRSSRAGESVMSARRTSYDSRDGSIQSEILAGRTGYAASNSALRSSMTSQSRSISPSNRSSRGQQALQYPQSNSSNVIIDNNQNVTTNNNAAYPSFPELNDNDHQFRPIRGGSGSGSGSGSGGPGSVSTNSRMPAQQGFNQSARFFPTGLKEINLNKYDGNQSTAW